MMYHETRDPALVMEALGHRSITTTMLYIHLEKALLKTDNSGFHVRATKDTEEVKGLFGSGIRVRLREGRFDVLQEAKMKC